MIGALAGLAFLAGFLGGWLVVPLGIAAGLLAALAVGRYWLLVAVAALALVLGAWRAPHEQGPPTVPAVASGASITGVITSSVVDDGVVQRFRLAVDDVAICARTFARSDLGRGDRVAGVVDVTDPSTISESYGRYLRSQGCGASGTISRIDIIDRGHGVRRNIDEIRQSVTRTIVSWVPGDRGALLAGLVIGDDSLMSDDATDAFARTGTIHVVAVSGSNLALLASILVIGNAFFARRAFSESLGISVIWAYVLFGGAVPPTLRAGILATLAAGARLVGRPADILTLSIQVAAIQAAIWPASTLGLSYRLSTVAIFGVLIATAGRSFEGWLAGIRIVAMTTIVVSVAMLPILPEASRPILLFSLLTNIAISPLVAISFTLGVAAILVGVPFEPLGESIAVTAGEINGLTLSIVTRVAEIQSLPGPLDSSGSSAPVWLIWLVALVFMATVSTEFRRWVCDVSQRTYVTERMAEVATGAAIGTICATFGIALLR